MSGKMDQEIENILNKIHNSIAIWDNNRCVYTNDNIYINVKINDELDEYVLNNQMQKYNYENILKNKNDIVISKKDRQIYLYYLSSTKILEEHVKNIFPNLLPTISHKIRNPLTNIIGMLMLIESKIIDDENTKYIGIIKKSTHEIISIVNSLVDILNYNAPNNNINSEIIDIYKLLHEYSDKLENKNIITINIDENVPKLISVDKHRLKIILDNILKNANFFTNMGKIEIDLSLYCIDNLYLSKFLYTPVEQPLYNILFKIKDTGLGFEIEHENSIKYLLKMTDIDENNLNLNVNYNGFGLLISKYMCNDHGGNIWFTTKKDFGTTFFFNIIVSTLLL